MWTKFCTYVYGLMDGYVVLQVYAHTTSPPLRTPPNLMVGWSLRNEAMMHVMPSLWDKIKQHMDVCCALQVLQNDS